MHLNSSFFSPQFLITFSFTWFYFLLRHKMAFSQFSSVCQQFQRTLDCLYNAFIVIVSVASVGLFHYLLCTMFTSYRWLLLPFSKPAFSLNVCFICHNYLHEYLHCYKCSFSYKCCIFTHPYTLCFSKAFN